MYVGSDDPTMLAILRVSKVCVPICESSVLIRRYGFSLGHNSSCGCCVRGKVRPYSKDVASVDHACSGSALRLHPIRPGHVLQWKGARDSAGRSGAVSVLSQLPTFLLVVSQQLLQSPSLPTFFFSADRCAKLSILWVIS